MSDDIRALYRSAAHRGARDSAIPWLLGPELCPALRDLMLTPGLSGTDEWWEVVEAAHHGILSPDWERVRAALEDGHAPAVGDIDYDTPKGAHWARWWACAVPPSGLDKGYLADQVYYCGDESPGQEWLLYAVAADMQRQLRAQGAMEERVRDLERQNRDLLMRLRRVQSMASEQVGELRQLRAQASDSETELRQLRDELDAERLRGLAAREAAR